MFPDFEKLTFAEGCGENPFKSLKAFLAGVKRNCVYIVPKTGTIYTQFRLTPAKKAFNGLKGFSPHPSAKVKKYIVPKTGNIPYSS